MSRFAYSACSPPCGGGDLSAADDDCGASPSMFSPVYRSPSAQLFSEPTSDECNSESADLIAETADRSLPSPVKHLSRESPSLPIPRESSDEPSDAPRSTVVAKDSNEEDAHTGEDADYTIVPVVLLSTTYDELNFVSSPTVEEDIDTDTSEETVEDAATAADRAEFSRKRKLIQTVHPRKLFA